MLDVTRLSTQRLSHVFHIADLHVPMDSRRIDEYRSVFDSFVRAVVSHPATRAGTALLVVAGDVLHHKCKTGTDSGAVLFRFINSCLENLPVAMICGNHDFRQDEPSVGDAISMLVAPYSGCVTRHPIVYMERTGLYAWGNVGFGVTSVKDTLRPNNTSGMVDALPGYPDPSIFGQSVTFRVALFHGSVSGSVDFPGTYPIKWFQGYDAGMFGDCHKQQVKISDARTSPPITWAYPGSMIQQTFGESTFGHGFVEWNVASMTATPRHIPNEWGRFTMTQEDGDNNWNVSFDNADTGIPLGEAAICIPRLGTARVAGDRVLAKRALEDAGLPDVSVQTCRRTGGRRPDARVSCNRLSNSRCVDGPEALMRFVSESGHRLSDLETRFLRGVDLCVPEAIAFGADSSGNEEIMRLQDAYLSESSKREKPDMRLMSLRWGWLLCYGADNLFDFSAADGRVVLLNGPNASGKSSFLDVLHVAIFGEETPARKSTGCFVNNLKPPGAVPFARVVFSSGGRLLELCRTFDGSRTKSAMLHSVTALGARNEKLCEGPSKVRQFVAESVGTPLDFAVANVVPQHDDSSFFSLKPAQRKEVVEAALNTQRINALQALLKKAMSVHTKALATCDEVISEHRYAIAEQLDDDAGASECLEAALRETEEAAEKACPSRVSFPSRFNLATAREAAEEDGRPDEEIKREIEEIGSVSDSGDVVALECAVESVSEWLSARVGLKVVSNCVSVEAAREALDIALASEPPGAENASCLAERARMAREWRRANDGLDTGNLANLRERRDELAAHSCLRRFVEPSFVPGDNCAVEFDAEEASRLARAYEDLEISASRDSAEHEIPAARDSVGYEAWRSRFPADWDIPAVRALRADITREISVADSRLQDLGFCHHDAPRKEEYPVDARRLDELRAAVLSGPHEAATLAKQSVVAKERSRRDAIARDLKGHSVASLDAKILCTTIEIRSAASLKKRIAALRETADAHIDVNPDCPACSRRSCFVEKQDAIRELKLAESEIRSTGRDLGRELELFSVMRAAREQLDSTREAFEAMDAEAETETRALRRLADLQPELDDLEARAAWERDELFSARDDACRVLQEMDDFLSEAGGRLARHAASERKRIRASLSDLAGAWRSRLSDCESQVDRLTAFLSQESHWTAVEEAVAENRHVLCAYETWQRDLSRARSVLEQSEFNAASERLARYAAALSTAERSRDLKETADRNGAVLAYREFSKAVQRRSELSASAKKIFGELSVLRERKKLKKSREDRIALLGERRAEIEERRAALKSVTACLFGSGDDNGIKRWLYNTHVVPFLESEINDFVGQIDDFSISVSLKNADDLCFGIRDRGACPSIDHASGFQRFVLSMGMRIALGRMGAGTPVKHFFIDEGFTACDASNMRLVRPILDAIMTQGGFRSVVIISHLEAVKEVADLSVQVYRGGQKSLSRVHFAHSK